MQLTRNQERFADQLLEKYDPNEWESPLSPEEMRQEVLPRVAEMDSDLIHGARTAWNHLFECVKPHDFLDQISGMTGIQAQLYGRLSPYADGSQDDKLRDHILSEKSPLARQLNMALVDHHQDFEYPEVLKFFLDAEQNATRIYIYLAASGLSTTAQRERWRQELPHVIHLEPIARCVEKAPRNLVDVVFQKARHVVAAPEVFAAQHGVSASELIEQQLTLFGNAISGIQQPETIDRLATDILTLAPETLKTTYLRYANSAVCKPVTVAAVSHGQQVFGNSPERMEALFDLLPGITQWEVGKNLVAVLSDASDTRVEAIHNLAIQAKQERHHLRKIRVDKFAQYLSLMHELSEHRRTLYWFCIPEHDGDVVEFQPRALRAAVDDISERQAEILVMNYAHYRPTAFGVMRKILGAAKSWVPSDAQLEALILGCTSIKYSGHLPEKIENLRNGIVRAEQAGDLDQRIALMKKVESKERGIVLRFGPGLTYFQRKALTKFGAFPPDGWGGAVSTLDDQACQTLIDLFSVTPWASEPSYADRIFPNAQGMSRDQILAFALTVAHNHLDNAESRRLAEKARNTPDLECKRIATELKDKPRKISWPATDPDEGIGRVVQATTEHMDGTG